VPRGFNDRIDFCPSIGPFATVDHIAEHRFKLSTVEIELGPMFGAALASDHPSIGGMPGSALAIARW
jgi:hypothetical protein